MAPERPPVERRSPEPPMPPQSEHKRMPAEIKRRLIDTDVGFDW